MTNVARKELAPHGISVTGLHVGYMDTEMADLVDPADKTDPAIVAAVALHGVAAGETEVLADAFTQSIKQQLSATPVAA